MPKSSGAMSPSPKQLNSTEIGVSVPDSETVTEDKKKHFTVSLILFLITLILWYFAGLLALFYLGVKLVKKGYALLYAAFLFQWEVLFPQASHFNSPEPLGFYFITCCGVLNLQGESIGSLSSSIRFLYRIVLLNAITLHSNRTDCFLAVWNHFRFIQSNRFPCLPKLHCLSSTNDNHIDVRIVQYRPGISKDFVDFFVSMPIFVCLNSLLCRFNTINSTSNLNVVNIFSGLCLLTDDEWFSSKIKMASNPDLLLK